MRGVAQHYPNRIEALSVNPARFPPLSIAVTGNPRHAIPPHTIGRDRGRRRARKRAVAMATGRPKNERETQTDRDKTHILYKRD